MSGNTYTVMVQVQVFTQSKRQAEALVDRKIGELQQHPMVIWVERGPVARNP